MSAIRLIRSSVRRPACVLLWAAWLLLWAGCAVSVAGKDYLRLEAMLDTAARSLTGAALVRLEVGDSRSFPPLALAPEAVITDLTLNGEAVAHRFTGGILRVAAPDTLRGAVRLSFKYTCVFDDPFPVAPYAMDNPGFGVAGTITEDAAFLLPGSGWYPRPVSHDAAVPLPAEISISAPATPRPIWAVTQGSLLGHVVEDGRAVSRWSIDAAEGAARGYTLMAGPYVVEQRQVEGAAGESSDVLTYFTEPIARLSSRYLDAVSRHLRFYETLHGPYAFPKFAVVENFFPTGYGMPSMTVLGRRVLALPFIPETSLRHEVAHCWWGNGVQVDYTAGNWCEGLTTYVADHQKAREESTEAAAAYRRRTLRRFVQVGAHVEPLPLQRFAARRSPETQAIGYGKAMFVFHMAREHMGEDRFYAALADIYDAKLFKEASWEDFRRAFVAQGMDDAYSRTFLQQWTELIGGPRLSLVDVKSERSGDTYIVSGVLLQDSGTEPYLLDVEVEAVAGDERVATTVRTVKERTPFTLHTRERPARLQADPDVHVFRILDPGEIPPSVNGIKGASSLAVIVSDAMLLSGDAPMELARRLAASLSQPDAAILREAEVEYRNVDNASILFLGWPETQAARALLPRFPAGVQLNGQGGVFPGGATTGGADTVFVAGRRHAAIPAGVLWTAPGSAADGFEAVSRATLKLTHYGRYGYLAFAGGNNLAKGEFPPPETPLTIDLTE